MFGISMVMMPDNFWHECFTNEFIKSRTAVNNTFRQVASSIGTAVLISVLTNVTKDGLPASDLLKTAPLTYRDQATKRNTKRLSRSLLRGNNLWRSRFGDYFLLK